MVSEVSRPTVTVAQPIDRRLQALLVLLIMAVGLLYYLLLAPNYQFGRMGDDAHYAMLARSLATGQGFTDFSLPGDPVDTFAPPGYPALLAPVAFVFPGSITALSAVSLFFAVLCIPLLWVYLRLRQLPFWLTAATTFTVAVNPIFGFYSTVIMAETAFVACLLIALIALHYYERSPHLFGRAGQIALFALAALIYLKQAGLAIPFAAAAYLWLVRKRQHAVVIAVGVALLIAPLFIGRVLVGSPATGSGYQVTFDQHYAQNGTQGVERLLRTISDNLGSYLTYAFAVTMTPVNAYLLRMDGEPLSMLLGTLWAVLVGPLIIVGAVVWLRRYRDASVLMALGYFGMVLIWPYVNERRVILMLPLAVAYFFVGLRFVFLEAVAYVMVLRRVGIAALVVILLAFGVTLGLRYRSEYNETYVSPPARLDMSADAPWMQFLSAETPPDALVGTEFQYAVHYQTQRYTGDHVINLCGGIATGTDPETFEPFWQALAQDAPQYILLTGKILDPQTERAAISQCLRPLMRDNPVNFVRVYSQRDGLVELYQVLGTRRGVPGESGRINLVAAQPRYGGTVRDAAFEAGLSPDLTNFILFPQKGQATLSVSLNQSALVDTIAIGHAVGSAGAFESLRVSLQAPDGTWQTVALLRNTSIGGAGAAVGSGTGGAQRPYFYHRLQAPALAVAIRLTFTGGDWFALRDLAVIGSPMLLVSPPRADDGLGEPISLERVWQPVIWSDGRRDHVAVSDGFSLYLPVGSNEPLPLTVQIGNARAADQPVILFGTWQGMTQPTQGVYQGGLFKMPTPTPGATRVVSFGTVGDIPIVGDWDGDGVTTYGVYRAGKFYLTNDPAASRADVTFSVVIPFVKDPLSVEIFPLAGDWDGDGKDTPGVRAGNTFVLWNDLQSPTPLKSAQVFTFGRMGDLPLAGDWDGDGKADVGVLRENALIMRSAATGAVTELPYLESRAILPILGRGE